MARIDYDNLSECSFDDLIVLFENACINMYRTQGDVWEKWKDARLKVRKALLARYNFSQ